MSDEFAVFVKEVQPGMHNLAMALTAGDTHEAEDLVQASLERIWSRWGRLRIEHPRSYARTVVAREFATQRRRVRWKREHLTRDTPELVIEDFTRCSDEALVLFRALRHLPRRQREVVVLRHLEDMSVAEVAETLSCSEGSVKRSAYDGLRTLRAAVEEPMGRK